MRRIILIGRSESGKTTLTQALKQEKITYQKTQYVNNTDVIIDTPGEYIQTKGLAAGIALYAYEADVVGLLIAANEQYSLFPPNCTCMVNREVVGIVTKIDDPKANIPRAERWLRLSGCEKIFHVNARNNEGIVELLEYLNEKPHKNNKKQK